MNPENTETKSLSPSQTARGLNAFLTSAVFGGAWLNTAQVASAIFTGYALWLGATEADIAFLVAMSSFVSLVQFGAVKIFEPVPSKKILVIILGWTKVVLRFLPICIPLFLSQITHRVAALYVLVTFGMLVTYMGIPFLGDWLALVIPKGLRASFTSKRFLGMTLSVAVVGYVLGRFLDLFPEEQRYQGFLWVFLFGLVTGLVGQSLLLRAPYPGQRNGNGEEPSLGVRQVLKDVPFRRLLLFRFSLQFSIGFAAPFYSVYMLRTLQLSYATIALYANLAMVIVLLCHRPMGGLVARFGSKPVMQMLLVPGTLAPLIWLFSAPQYFFFVPVAMVAVGLVQAGSKVVLLPLVYGMVPEQGDRSSYFATWSVSMHLSVAAATLISGLLARQLAGFHREWWGIQCGSLQIIFVLASFVFLVPNLLLMGFVERKAETAGLVFWRLRKGNPLAYLYNFCLMNYFSDESLRVRAASGMARSGSPMAVEDLVQALEDLSPEVRRKAAEGLGLLHSEDAVAPLISQLADPDSDIRAEATEALGNIRHPLGLDALLVAMEDSDPRVRNGAIRALGKLGGDGICLLLLEKLTGPFDRQILPTLVDTLSRMGENQVVHLALAHLHEFHSPVIRAQLLNSICRSLGAGEDFYRIAIQDELKRSTRINALLQTARRIFSEPGKCMDKNRDGLRGTIDAVQAALERGNARKACEEMAEMARKVMDFPAPAGSEKAEAAEEAKRPAAALVSLLKGDASRGAGQLEALFGAICLAKCANDWSHISETRT